jgi:hypothetical protein
LRFFAFAHLVTCQDFIASVGKHLRYQWADEGGEELSWATTVPFLGWPPLARSPRSFISRK